MSDPDRDLVLRVIANDDQHAFGELVKLHQSAVRNLLRKLTRGNDALADDIAQKTFIKAYRSIAKYRGDAKFSSWLYRIAYNTFLNEKRGEKVTVPYEEAFSDATVESKERSVDLAEDLEQAMRELSDEQVVVFDLHYKKGMSHPEIAESLEMPLGTVKTRIKRGLEKMRDLMKDWRTV